MILVRASQKFDFFIAGFSVIANSSVKKNCSVMLILLYSTKPDETKALGRTFIRRLSATLISAGINIWWIRNKFHNLTIIL